MTEPSIAITGASGDIGARFLLGRSRKGRTCRGLLRHVTPRLARFSTLDLRQTHLRAVGEIDAALDGVQVVVHCALDHSPGQPDLAVSRNLEILAALVAGCRSKGIRRFIHLSSIVTLPPRITPEALEHRTPSSEPDWYTRVKLASEQWLKDHASDLEVCIVRAGLVYGPYMNWTRHAAAVVARGALVLPAGHDAPCYGVHVDDVCALLEKLATHAGPLPGLIYAINPEPATWGDFFSVHARLLGLDRFGIERVALAELTRRATPAPAPVVPRETFSSEVTSWLWQSPPLNQLRRWRNRPQPLPPERLSLPELSAPTSSPTWPTLFELETYQSTARFAPELTGAAIGFAPALSFAEGMKSSIAWVKGDLTPFVSPA